MSSSSETAEGTEMKNGKLWKYIFESENIDWDSLDEKLDEIRKVFDRYAENDNYKVSIIIEEKEDK